ncbi:thiamine pyrophosphate-dependent enzyme, partial [bacterium]|nr:thiamine pyrophosphate-dependent enzyme [bacterium]
MKPLKVKNKLQDTPNQDPIFNVTCNLSSGKEIKCADPRAIRSLVALMDMAAVMGGAASHWGGPSALAEINSALHALVFADAKDKKKPWHELYNVINDAGHCENGLYALKALYGYADLSLETLKGFRSIESKLTGHGEAHLFAEGVMLSNGPLGSAMGPSQGLALADSLSKTDRVTVTTISDGASMEGEAKEAFAAIPGMAAKGQVAPYVLIVSDNNTKLSGRVDEQSFSMAPSFAAMETLGWKVLKLEKAHDLTECLKVLSEAIEIAKANPQQPVMVHAKTIKGYGVKKTAESASGGHGFPLKKPAELTEFINEIYTTNNAYESNKEIPEEINNWTKELIAKDQPKAASTGPKKVKVQEGVSKALIKKRKEGLPVISVTSDLPGSTGLAAFHKECPDSFIDVGIAESNMVSVATGLSKQG